MIPDFDFTDEEIFSNPSGRLLSMEIEFTRRCNYACPYCYAAGPCDFSGEMTPDEIRSAIRQAAELGARKIVVLGGEPLVYGGFFEMADLIISLGMKVEMFTNGALVTATTAAELFKRGIRVVVKLNSPDPAVHDRLTGRKGAFDASMRAFDNLFAAGYSSLPEGMVGSASPLMADNIDSAVEMWKYLRSRKISPYFECLTPQGRLLENRALLPDIGKVEKVFREIAAFEAGQGRPFDPQPPLVGGKCFRHRYSCALTSSGDVFPCVGIAENIGNIREKSLSGILSQSLILQRLRDYRKYIKRPCRDCEKIDRCYGCRGAAWQTTGDYLAADPTCWRNADKLDMIHPLPVGTAGMLPHRPPMAMPGRIIHAGNRGGDMEFVPDGDNLFIDPATGEVASESLIESAAQCVAAFDTFLRDGKVMQGMLAEVNSFRSYAGVRRGESLVISFENIDDLEPWHIIAFRINNSSGVKVAEGEIKLCVPEET